MAKFLPVIGELITTVESGAKLVGAAAVLPFSTEKAGELLDGAGKAWVDYSEQNLIAAPINMGVRAAIGDEEGSEKVKKELEQSFQGFVDGTPVVGHVKGAVHYASGDKEHGDKCMKQASRTAATIAVAVGTGILTGGAGTVATVAATTAASTAAGVGMDIVTTGVDSVVHDEYRPAGVVEGVTKAYETGYINAIIDSAIGIGGEEAVDLGKVRWEAVEKTGTDCNSDMRSTAGVKAYAQLEEADGEQGAKQSVEVTNNIEGGEFAEQTTTTALSVKTQMDTETCMGVNRTARKKNREFRYKKKQQQAQQEWKGCSDPTRKKELKREKPALCKEGTESMKPVKKRSVYKGQSQKFNSKVVEKKSDQDKFQQENEKFRSVPQQKPESGHKTSSTKTLPMRRASQHTPNKCKRPVVRRKSVPSGMKNPVPETSKLLVKRTPQVCAQQADCKSNLKGNSNDASSVSVPRQRDDAPQNMTVKRCDDCKPSSDLNVGDNKTDASRTTVALGELDTVPPLKQHAQVNVGENDSEESAALQKSVGDIAELKTQVAALAVTRDEANSQTQEDPQHAAQEDHD